MDLPFTFLPLDKLSCVTGFNSYQEENVYSNEVRNTQKEILNVRIGKQTVAQGLYQEIKDQINNKGGKFTSSVYIAYKDGGDLRIGNIKFKGASLGPWIDLQNSAVNLSENAVAITGKEIGEQGAIKYSIPIMEPRPVKEETNREADKLYETVQEYLDWKVERNEVETLDKPDGEQMAENAYGGDPVAEGMSDDLEDMNDDLPF